MTSNITDLSLSLSPKSSYFASCKLVFFPELYVVFYARLIQKKIVRIHMLKACSIWNTVNF